MGLLDVVLGRTKLKAPAASRLFAITTACVTFTTELGMKPAGRGAVVFQELPTADFDAVVDQMRKLVTATGDEVGAKVEATSDEIGFQWLLITDSEFESLAVAINAVGDELEAGGYGDRLLCAVFPFLNRSGATVYWIYNYKRGTFYPFVPMAGQSQERDTEQELRLKAQAAAELPIEPELERWLALWDAPL